MKHIWHKFSYEWELENGRQNKSQQFCLLSAPQYTWLLSRSLDNLKAVSHRSSEICNRKFERKKNGHIKGMVSSRVLVLFYTIHMPSHGFWGTRAIFQGNKGNFAEQEHRKTRLVFFLRNKAIFSRRTREQVPPWEGLNTTSHTQPLYQMSQS